MANKLKLDVNIVLPDVGDSRDACFRRICDALRSKAGIQETHLVEGEYLAPEQLCIHFDPDVVSMQDVRRLVEHAGAELHRKYGHLLTEFGSMHPRKARRLTSELTKVVGVLEAVISPAGMVRVEFDRERSDEATIRRKLDVLISSSTPTHDDAHEGDHEGHAHSGILGEATELIFVALSGVTLIAGWLLTGSVSVPVWVPLGFLVGSYFFGGFFALAEAIASVRGGRFEIDFLMLIAAAGAAALGAWSEGALLLFLFSLGHALEGYAMGRAKRAIEALGELAPKVAFVRRNGLVTEVTIEQLKVGDIVIVKPNERLPADGFVVKGESSINQAPVTGESVPVDKQSVGDVTRAAQNPEAVGSENRVFAGTINGAGALEIYVTRAAGDSTLARVVVMVREAETNQSPTQQLTDRFERIFVPAILAGAVLMMFSWVIVDEPFSESFYRAMALLVAASPCALAIATPSAILSGVARAARGGVLVKGGAPLENLGRLTMIAFDKTGTLTEGRPRLVDLTPAPGVSEEELLRVAVGVESLSDHPLATAIVRDGMARLGSTSPMEASEVRSITGRGVRAQVAGETTHIGKAALFAEIGGPKLPYELVRRIEELEVTGRTTMVVRHGAQYLGVIGLMDTPRTNAQTVVAQLRRLGIRRMLLISGDNQAVADAVARDVGLGEAYGNLMPDDKVETIKRLGRESKIAMVGDGVNDAPAMANATVGIAMGAAGSDVALETADVALMADDLNHLVFAIGLSRATSRIIRQNLWLSLGVVAVLVPSTIAGLGIGSAVLFHEGSTLLVVFNALRLLAFKTR